MAKGAPGGNLVSEWYGQRIYPEVRVDVRKLTGAHAGECPFLTDALHRSTACVKATNSKGVCTISSVSNGPRQDWLVCPLRVINSDIVSRSCRRIFGLDRDVLPLPVSILKDAAELAKFTAGIAEHGAGYLFFQNKLGGEISISGTPKSPELSFDVTLVEITLAQDGSFAVSRYGILELQTMDYHGTYKKAVDNLSQGLRLHPRDFARTLKANLNHWAGEGIEGPNVANVFKRTFYQVLLKFRLSGTAASAAGTVLALPQSVWDSWQPFLGAPEIEDVEPGVQRLVANQKGRDIPDEAQLNAYICVFDLDASSDCDVSPVVIKHFVHVSPERMAQHAFTEVPANMLESVQAEGSVLARIRLRLANFWPAFKPPRAARVPKAPKAAGTASRRKRGKMTTSGD